MDDDDTWDYIIWALRKGKIDYVSGHLCEH